MLFVAAPQGAAPPRPRARRRRSAQPDNGASSLGFALLSACALVAVTSAFEHVLGAWRAAAKRRRRAGKAAAFISPAASALSLPKLLTGGATHAPRGLPEGEYMPSPRARSGGGISAPPSPEPPRGAAPSEPRQLRSIPSAAELGALGVGQANDEWAGAVARGEAWTQTEPWKTLWLRSQQDAQQEAHLEAEAAEEARWEAVAARGRQIGWAEPALLLRSAGGMATKLTEAEVQQAVSAGEEAAAHERQLARQLQSEHAARVRQLAPRP